MFMVEQTLCSNCKYEEFCKYVDIMNDINKQIDKIDVPDIIIVTAHCPYYDYKITDMTPEEFYSDATIRDIISGKGLSKLPQTKLV